MEDYEYQKKTESSSSHGYQNKRSDSMGSAALVMGIISATTPYFIVTSIICGPLAIILGLLSKGGELETDTRGKVSIFLGILGLVLVTLLIILVLRTLILQAGGIEPFLEDYWYSTDPVSSYPDTI